MCLLTVTGRMLFIIGVQLFPDPAFLLLRERSIHLAVFPAIPPAIPGGERGMSACPDTIIHHVRQDLATRTLEHTLPQNFVCVLAVLLCSALPISDIVGQAAIAPPCPVFHGAVREQAAAVTGKVMELGGKGGSIDQEDKGKDLNYC